MPFYEDYKPLRNKIREYNSRELIFTSVSLLHKLDKMPVGEWKYYLPWEILLLTKWIISEHTSIKKPKVINDAVFNGLIAKLQKLFELYRSDALSLYSKHQLPKFLRQTAFQQFWLQKAGHISTEIMARQLMLLLPSPLEKRDKINDLFFKKTGISIKSFFEISLMILAKFLDEKNTEIGFVKDYFKECAHSFTNNELDNYFKLLSLSFDEAKEHAAKDLVKKRDKLEFQIFEQTPFTFYPFLRDGDGFILYSPALMHYVIKYYVYDYLKLHYGSDFLQDFGGIFENYLKLGLDFSAIKYEMEEDLKKILPKNNQVVDFFIEYENKLVLVDAKATEMRGFTIEIQSNEFISNTLERNVIKGIKQCYQVAKNFKNKEKIYSIIVTYKDLYLGSVGGIWDEFLKDNLRSFFEEQKIDEGLISSDNIYVISIEDFDLLMKAIRIDKSNLIKILDQATELDKSGATGKHILGQHIKEFLPTEYEMLPYLAEVSESFNQDMIKRFTTQNKISC